MSQAGIGACGNIKSGKTLTFFFFFFLKKSKHLKTKSILVNLSDLMSQFVSHN